MNIFRVGIYILISAVLVGCSPLAKVIYGIKDPNQPVTKEVVLKFAEEHQLDTERIAFPSNYDTSLVTLLKLFGSVPEVIIFNKDGNRVLYKPEDLNCNASVEDFISALSSKSHVTVDSTMQLSDVTSLILLNDREAPALGKSADYFIFISWATWMGSKNYDEHERRWMEAIIDNRAVLIEAKCICFDLIEGAN